MRAKLLLGLVLAASIGLASCATGRTAETRRGVTDAAMSPLRDVGLMRPEIPLALRNLNYPYSTVTLTDCAAVTREIGALDAALGPESYQPGPGRNIWDRSGDFVEDQAIDYVEGTAQDLIPFRSWVRRISGASRAERDALRAAANGQQRRTFLRGYGASLGCPSMIPPPPPQTQSNNSRNSSR
jgi:hypothetical protein